MDELEWVIKFLCSITSGMTVNVFIPGSVALRIEGNSLQVRATLYCDNVEHKILLSPKDELNGILLKNAKASLLHDVKIKRDYLTRVLEVASQKPEATDGEATKVSPALPWDWEKRVCEGGEWFEEFHSFRGDRYQSCCQTFGRPFPAPNMDDVNNIWASEHVLYPHAYCLALIAMGVKVAQKTGSKKEGE